MIRAAEPADRAALDAFLLTHADRAMFALTNLRQHGIAAKGFGSAHPHATRFWLVGPGVRWVIALSQAGMLLPVLPHGADMAGLAGALAGVEISGAVGPVGQVRPALAALGLTGRAVVDRDEPGFALDLAALILPAGKGAVLVTPGAAEREQMLVWRSAYNVEILGASVARAQKMAVAEIDAYLARGSHRLLLRGGEAVAMTGFNAILPEIVQVGGVFTPLALRGQGFARLAVALHLAQARAAGVRRAVLFAANAAAARAYRSIGFQPVGEVALVMFDGMQAVAA
ncbi:MAG: GNAT family N-acetyltransferase [Paracoccaceae bacterium]